jgi:hypothetical protein
LRLNDRTCTGCLSRHGVRRWRQREKRDEASVADNGAFKRLVLRTAFATVGFAAGLVFGILLLIDGDWIPGAIIVAATLVGLAGQVFVIRRLCTEGRSPSPARHRPAH